MADYNSSLPVRTETDGDVVGKIIGKASGEIAEVNANDELLVHDQDTKDAVDAVATALGDGTQVTKITDGVDELEVNSDGSINVVVVEAGVSATEKQIYATTVAGVPNTPNTTISYTVTALKTFLIKKVFASGSGTLKVELKTGTPSSETTKAVAFSSTANPNADISLPAPIEVIAGDKILVIITNKDKANQDLYAFVNGNEV